MTPIRIHAPLLRALHTLARTFCVAFLAIPGTGFALLAVACGDLDVPRESMTHDAVVADSIASPITAHPIRPVLDEPIESPSVPEPPQPSVTELSEEPRWTEDNRLRVDNGTRSRFLGLLAALRQTLVEP